MVRIFLAPKFDERGQGWLFKDQRLMMVEVDKFVAACEFKESSSFKALQAENIFSEAWTEHFEETLG